MIDISDAAPGFFNFDPTARVARMCHTLLTGDDGKPRGASEVFAAIVGRLPVAADVIVIINAHRDDLRTFEEVAAQAAAESKPRMDSALDDAAIRSGTTTVDSMRSPKPTHLDADADPEEPYRPQLSRDSKGLIVGGDVMKLISQGDLEALQVARQVINSPPTYKPGRSIMAVRPLTPRRK